MALPSVAGVLAATSKKTTLRDLISFGAERRVGGGVKIYPSAFGTLTCLEGLHLCPHCRCLRHCFVRKSEGEALRWLICAIHEVETETQPVQRATASESKSPIQE